MEARHCGCLAHRLTLNPPSNNMKYLFCYLCALTAIVLIVLFMSRCTAEEEHEKTVREQQYFEAGLIPKHDFWKGETWEQRAK